MKKILITGASGFIGGFLVEEALNRGLEVYAAVRKSSSRQYLKDSRINFIIVDFRNQQLLNEIIADYKFDFIIHNAGLTHASEETLLNEVNASYLNNLIEAINCSTHTTEKLCFISSLAAFGPADKQDSGIVSNDSIPKPVTKYGRSKLKGENILKKEKELKWNIVRPTAVYGPREHELLSLFKTIDKGIEPKLGFSPQKLSLIYVIDLAKIILDVTISAPNGGCYFAGDGNLYSPSELNYLIKTNLNRKTFKITIPIPVLSLIALINQTLSNITGNYPILNLDKINELKVKSWSIETDNLKNDINFAAFTKLEAGISSTIKWYRENGWL